jgi:hypothetical protein
MQAELNAVFSDMINCPVELIRLLWSLNSQIDKSLLNYRTDVNLRHLNHLIELNH